MPRLQRQSTLVMTSTRALAVAATLAVATLAPRAAARAQGAPDREAAIEMRKQYISDLGDLHQKFVALAEAIPADKFSWRPAPGVRSVGEAFMHVASEFYTYAPASYGAERSPIVTPTQQGFAKFEAASSKEDVLKNLHAGWAYTQQSLNAIDPAALVGPIKVFGGSHTILETSLGVVDDLHEHLGQLIAYARMNGVVPPWSK